MYTFEVLHQETNQQTQSVNKWTGPEFELYLQSSLVYINVYKPYTFMYHSVIVSRFDIKFYTCTSYRTLTI